MIARKGHLYPDHWAQLQRAARISSPLLGLLGVVPMALFLRSGSMEEALIIQKTPELPFVGLFLITTVIFIVWQMNLRIRYVSPGSESDDSFRHRPYHMWISYAAVLSFTGFLIWFRDSNFPRELGAIRFYPLVGMFVNNTIIILLMNSIENSNENMRLKLEKRDLELTNLLAVHEQLKQQIQPHFLFNALSNLQAMINKKPKAAMTYVEVLSSFLRNSIRMNSVHTATVKEELAFFNDYITLQQLRFGASIRVEVEIPEEVQAQGKLPVFSLQVLGENAIKHNVFTAEGPLSIRIWHEDGWLRVSNNRATKYQSQKQVSGTGLRNLTERFRLLTTKLPEVQSDTDTYRVSIPVLA